MKYYRCKGSRRTISISISVLRRLLCIRAPPQHNMLYSASERFVSCVIPSFYELLRRCIFGFSEQISKNTNSIIEACLSTKSIYFFLPLDNGGVQYYFDYINYFMPIIYCYFLIPLH